MYASQHSQAQRIADVVFFIVTLASQIALIWVSFEQIGNETTVLITFLFYSILVVLLIVAFLDKFLEQRLMVWGRGKLLAVTAIAFLLYGLGLMNFAAIEVIDIDSSTGIAVGTTLGLVWIALAYFMYSNPRFTRVLSGGVTGNVAALEKRLQRKTLSRMNLDQTIERSVKTLLSIRNEAGYWGERSPILETSWVIIALTETGMNSQSTWIKRNGRGTQVHSLLSSYEYLRDHIEEGVDLSRLENALAAYAMFRLDNGMAKYFERDVDKALADVASQSEWDLLSALEMYSAKTRIYNAPTFPFLLPIGFAGAAAKEKCNQIIVLVRQMLEVVNRRKFTRFRGSQTQQSRVTNEIFGWMLSVVYQVTRSKEMLDAYVAHINENQEIEGTWDSRLISTAVVVSALSEIAIRESMELKKGVNVLLEAADHRGLWGDDDLVKTSHALWALAKARRS